MTSPKTWKGNKLTAFKHLIKVTACWYNTYINRALVDKQIDYNFPLLLKTVISHGMGKSDTIVYTGTINV